MIEIGPNLVRTYVPVIVGGVASWLTAHGIHVNAATETQVIVVMTSVFTAAYYTIARVLEERFPAIGAVLLGSRPAQQLGPADMYPEPYEGETWPPAEAPVGGPPTGPAPVTQPPAAPQQGSLAELVASTPPARKRGPQTGAVPMYRRPPGR